MSKTCRAFQTDDREIQNEHLSRLIKIEEYGDVCNGHFLHTWDDGHRFLCKCPLCNALVLVQSSEFHGYGDDYYKDYFPVGSKKEAERLNKHYDGWQMERIYKGKRIYKTY